MTLKDLIEETKSALLANVTRSLLTMLGIVIGISSVIVMLAIGNGAQSSIESSISSLGSNILTISPGGGRQRVGGVAQGRSNGQQSLTREDAEAISLLPLVTSLSPETNSRTQIIAGSNNTNTTVVGVLPTYQTVHALSLDDGIFISSSNVRNFSKVAVLGPTTRDDLFGVGASVVGETIRISNTKYTVIGVAAPKGGSGFGNVDDRIYIPLQTAQQYLTGSSYVSSIAVSTVNQSGMTELEDQITSLLLSRHHIKDPNLADFSIFNQADLAATASSVTQIFTILLSSVAAISLIVGGIGIMNMMLTNVRERTREIGLRKAIGAKAKDINTQFLFEAIVLTVVGGVIGIIMGILISLGINTLGVLQTTVTIGPVVLAFSVSALIGIVFGYYPAKKAAQLNPIDALRYE
jgi:putative ABC transport system permease protein